MPSIAYIRQHYPEFNDYSDADIIDVANEFDISVTPDAPSAKSSNDRNFLTDTGVALESGALRVPGMMTGLLDIPFGYAGLDRPISRGWEAIGDRIGVSPGKLADELDKTQLSDDLLQSRQVVDQAWNEGNALDIAQSYIDNPRVVADTATRSVPAMLAGGLLGRAVVGAGTVGGAVGEGALSAGGAMDAIDDSASPEDRSTSALGSGLVVGAVSGLGGKIAGKLGLSDVDTLATGSNTVSHVARPMYQRVPLSTLQEGVEEGVQSASEQGFQNYAEGKPLTEGMARNTVEGMLAGNVMGFGAGFKAPKLNEAPPTLADLLNEARQQQADAEPQSASEAYTRAQERLSTIAESITGAEDIESALQAFHDSVATDILVAPEIDLSPTLQQELNNVQIENANYSNETGQGQQEGLLNAGTDPTVTDLDPTTPEFATPDNLLDANSRVSESSPDALGNAEQGIENQGALAADHVPSPNLTEPTNDVFTSPIIENEPGIFGQESVSIDAPGDNTTSAIQPSAVSTASAADQGATQDHQQPGAVPQLAASEFVNETPQLGVNDQASGLQAESSGAAVVDQAAGQSEALNEKLEAFPGILTQKKSTYIKNIAKASGLNPESTGYQEAVKRIENNYEEDKTKAIYSLPFEQAKIFDTSPLFTEQLYHEERQRLGIADSAKAEIPGALLNQEVAPSEQKYSIKQHDTATFDDIPLLFLDSLKLSVKNSEGESTQMKFADVYSHVKEQMQAYADFITCVRG